MLDMLVTGGVVIALAGVVQVAARWKRDSASPVALLREGMAGFEGSDAEAVRAEFRRSGVILPTPHRPAGFF